MDFEYHNREITRPWEKEWLSAAKVCRWGNSLVSDEITLWLDFQALIRRLLSDLLNGVSILRRRNPTDWLHYFTGDYKWWRISLWSQDRYLLRQMGLSKFQQPYLDLSTLRELLKESEAILTNVPKDIPLKRTIITVKKELSMTKVSNLQKYCTGLNTSLSLYIHGSKAIGDDTAFSDVDDLLILHVSAWRDLDTLKHGAETTSMIARMFQDLDPLQHHGHWIYSEFDLLCFDESIVPLIVLESAVFACGRHRLEVAIRPNPAGFRKILWTIIQEVRRDTLAAQSGKINLYWFKNLISGISLLPALTFQVLGQMIDKKSAISRAREIYSEQACEAIHWASEIRENWADVPSYNYLPTAKLIAKILAPKKRHMAEILIRRLLPPIPLDRIDRFKEIFPFILTIADESAERLREVV